MTSPQDVAAVVCTMNSGVSIRECLASLRAAGVGELIVVDASSSDGTREIALELADQVVDDPGIGLGNARNVGIAITTRPCRIATRRRHSARPRARPTRGRPVAVRR